MNTHSVTMLEFTFNAATAVVMTLSFISIMAPQVSKRNDELIINSIQCLVSKNI